MTFEESRAKHLETLDGLYRRLRVVAADPLWCNEAYKGFKAAMDAFEECLHKIARLNAVEQEGLQ